MAGVENMFTCTSSLNEFPRFVVQSRGHAIPQSWSRCVILQHMLQLDDALERLHRLPLSPSTLPPRKHPDFKPQCCHHRLSQQTPSSASWSRIYSYSSVCSSRRPTAPALVKIPIFHVYIYRHTRSSAPLTRWYLTPGQSWLLPPRTSTTECCWMLWPSPGM